MTAFKPFKSLLAGFAAVALIGTAVAQGNPPNPAIKNAPEGAGQRSTQNTPMGETGTPTGGATTSSGSTRSNMGSTNSSMGSTTAGSTSGASMGAASAASDTTMASSTRGHRAKRRMRADRN